jgi:hypothetical protein
MIVGRLSDIPHPLDLCSSRRPADLRSSCGERKTLMATNPDYLNSGHSYPATLGAPVYLCQMDFRCCNVVLVTLAVLSPKTSIVGV